ncbi:MAG: alpha/beta fold hydrolase [Cyclobacteriaceae bacterium]
MKTFVLSLCWFGLITLSCQPSKPAEEIIPAYTIEQFLNTEQIGGSSFSPDESKIMYSSKKTGIFNAYEIPIDSGQTQQLTDSQSESVFAISYFPEDERILYTSDQGGNEINHLFVKNLNGEATDLTPDSTAKAQFYGWSHDQQSFFYTSNTRNPQAFDLYELEVSQIDAIENNMATYQPRLIFENPGQFYPSAISEDKRLIALSEPITRQKVNMYLFDAESGDTQMISQPDDTTAYSPQYFSHDGKYLYYLSDENSEYSYLGRYDLQTGEMEKVKEAQWDVVYAYESRNGKYQVVATNEDARTKISITDQETGQAVVLPSLPDGEISSVNISKSENLMSFYVNSSTSPSDLYVYDFQNKQYQRLTNTLNSEIDQRHLVEGEIIRFASYDGMEIPSLLYRPKKASAESPVPAMLWIHGGPGGQSRLNYSALVQYLVNHGYAIFAVNNRGSSGYGKSFEMADNQKHGDADLKDCVAAKDFLATLEYIDSDKIGIMGGSYGGYMTLAGLAFTPDEFKVGVDIFGVSNWLRTLQSIPPWWGAARESLFAEMGNPETDSASLYDKSPLFFADQITKPLLVLQGANDPRVLQVESDEIVEAVKANNVAVEYIVFEDEGHGFLKKENQIEGYQAILKFLNQYLMDNEKQPEKTAYLKD